MIRCSFVASALAKPRSRKPSRDFIAPKLEALTLLLDPMERRKPTLD